VYHVTLRGNHRQPIFGTDEDRRALDDIVEHAVSRCGVAVHAYCWMTNHVHAVVQVGERPLGVFMHGVATRYARRFQRERLTTGHLFERRYHANLVASDAQLLATVRYTHLNPVRAGIVADPADYTWSGHRAYMGLGGPGWIRTGLVLELLAEMPGRARERYAAFVGGPAPASESSSVAGPDVMLFRSRPTDGGREMPSRENLEELIARICREENTSPEELRSPTKGHRASAIRARIAEECRDAGVATISEVARRFDRHVSSLSKAMGRRNAKR